MVQQVRKLNDERGADAFGGADLLGDGGVQIPCGEAADDTGAAVGGVQAEDWPAELCADGVGIGKQIYAASTPGRIAVEAAAGRDTDVVVRRVAAREVRQRYGVLIGGVAVSVNLAKRLRVGVAARGHADLKRSAALSGEQRRDGPSSQD